MVWKAPLIGAFILIPTAGGKPLAPPEPPKQQPPTLRLQRNLRIGAADGPPEYAFGDVAILAPTSGSGFFTFDAADGQIRRYDQQGRFVGLVGRPGAGPGEYRHVGGMAVHGDSLLLVYDPGNGRIAVFDTVGKYRRQISLARISTFFGDKMFTVGRDGLIGVRVALSGGEREGIAVPSQYLRLRLDGTIADSIPAPSAATQGWPFVLMTADGPRWSFPDQIVFDLLPDGGLVSARTTRYLISVSPRAGHPSTIQRPDRPVRIEGEERREWEAFVRYFASRSAARPPTAIPAVKPFVRDLIADESGRVWVHRYVAAAKRVVPPRPGGDLRPRLTVREVNRFDLFDPRGRFAGTIDLPPDALLLAIRGEHVYLRQEADGGEYFIDRYVIRGI